MKVHTIISGKTKPDNVCIAAADIDGDGHVDFVLGADRKPFNTKEGATLQWLKRGKTLDEEWAVSSDRGGAHGPSRPHGRHRRQRQTGDHPGPADGPRLVGEGKLGRRPAGAHPGVPRYPRTRSMGRGYRRYCRTSCMWCTTSGLCRGEVEARVNPPCSRPVTRASMPSASGTVSGDESNWRRQPGQPEGDPGASEIKMGILKDRPSYIATIDHARQPGRRIHATETW